MPDRRYVYRVELDNAQVTSAAQQVRAVFQRELGNIAVGSGSGGVTGGRSAAGGGSGSGRELIPGFGDVASVAGYTIAGVGIAALGRQAIQTTVALTEQGTTLRRTDVAAQQLAGSTEHLNELLAAYQRATGGVQTTGEATANVTKLMAIGFADTADELERFVMAARGASLATGNDLGYIIGQLQLSIANQSTMRLDQLGLGVSEVKARIEELKTTMSGLTAEGRYQEAVIGLLNEKYGGIVTSAEAGASGLEQLKRQMRELREESARGATDLFDPMFRYAAARAGSRDVDTQIFGLRGLAGATRAQNLGMVFGNTATQVGAMDRLAESLAKADEAARNGTAGAADYRAGLQELSMQMLTTGSLTDEQITKIDELEQAYRLAASGGIVVAQTIGDIGQQARYATGDIIELRSGLVGVIDEAGRFQYAQRAGPPTQPVTKTAPTPGAQGFFGGTLIGGMMTGDVGGFQQQYGAAFAQEQERQRNEATQAQEEAARKAESAWKDAASETERAWKDAASALEDSVRAIPGVFGASPVTQEQKDLAKLGVDQNFADNYLRRLTDEVLNKKDWAGVDINDAARRAGIDGSLDPKAILALFTQAWQDSSLFANPANLDLLDQGAIRAAMARQEASKTGQANLLGMFGLDAKGGFNQDVYAGMMSGASDGLAQFGVDAAKNMMTQLKSEAAMQEYNSAGAAAFAAMFDGFTAAAGTSDFVGAITAEVMRQLDEAVGQP